MIDDRESVSEPAITCVSLIQVIENCESGSEPAITCMLLIQVIDNRESGSEPVGVCKVPLSLLLESTDMTASRPFPLRESGIDSTVTLHLCLRVCKLLFLSVCHGIFSVVMIIIQSKPEFYIAESTSH